MFIDNLPIKVEPVERLEHIEFNVDPFLDSIAKPPLKQRPQCPRCLVHKDGSQPKYYCCPVTRFDAKCYATSSKENLSEYLKSVNEQTHPCYTKIAPEKFKCECDLSIVLVMSKSEQNPGHLYFKCPRKSCQHFNG